MYYPAPIVSYPGGKFRLRKKILPYFPIHIRTYYEPFCGGCSVLLAAKYNLYFNRPTLANDIDKYVVNAYQGVKLSPEKVCQHIQTFLSLYPNADTHRDFYDHAYDTVMNSDDMYLRSAS